MEWNGLEWNHGVEWSGMDFSGGCILVILCHFDTVGHFGSKFGCFFIKRKKNEFRDPPEADPSDYFKKLFVFRKISRRHFHPRNFALIPILATTARPTPIPRFVLFAF